MTEPRDRYADVGAAMRTTLERAWHGERRLSIHEWRVLGAVLGMTASYSRIADDTTITTLAMLVYGPDGADTSGAAGWKRRRTSEALSALADDDVITYTPGRGPGARIRIGLAAIESHPETGWLSPTRYDLELGYDSPERHPESGCDSAAGGDEKHPEFDGEVPGIRARSTLNPREKHPEFGAHREVLPRTLSEEDHREGDEAEKHPETGYDPESGCDSPAPTIRPIDGQPMPAPLRRWRDDGDPDHLEDVG